MRHLFASESVSKGHPDKMADQISDAVLDAFIGQDPQSRVACETMVSTGFAVIAGEITSKAKVDFQKIVRDTIRHIGYDDADMGFDYKSCAVMVALDHQSPDIAQGVGHTLSLDQGAGDQGLMFGYAVRETPELMPLPLSLSHKLMAAVQKARESKKLKYLRPDAKSQVVVEYDNRKPVRVHTIVISTQHHQDVKQSQIRKDMIEIIRKTVPAKLLDDKTIFHTNPTGRFVVGGPHGDCGLTGRKIIVDTYGGRGRHGGGAFSGKDPTKVDRSAAYAARWVAKNIVAAGLADECEVQFSYAIGVAHPLSIAVDCFGTGKLDDIKIVELVKKHFDLRPAAILKDLDLLKPKYLPTAALGHFGRSGAGFTWETTDRAAALKKDAKL